RKPSSYCDTVPVSWTMVNAFPRPLEWDGWLPGPAVLAPYDRVGRVCRAYLGDPPVRPQPFARFGRPGQLDSVCAPGSKGGDGGLGRTGRMLAALAVLVPPPGRYREPDHDEPADHGGGDDRGKGGGVQHHEEDQHDGAAQRGEQEGEPEQG